MRADFHSNISEIKNSLKEIYNKLREIPTKRKITITKEESVTFPSSFVYKPRFSPSFKKINRKTRKSLVSIFVRIRIILKPYSTDNFVNLKDIIDGDKNNKKSLIFLLENNTFKTDEVYGDYLVKTKQNFFELSYIRRGEKRKSLPYQLLNAGLSEIIKKDIILQIQNQFDSMWLIIEEELERCEQIFKMMKESESIGHINLIKRLLNNNECVYLEFKSKMYEIQIQDEKTKVHQRKEFIKDVLGLINNKSKENNTGRAYMLVGIDEKKEKYNGKHNNIEFDNHQLLIQLINEFITPHVDIDTTEFYLSGKQNNIELSLEKREGYDRCLILSLEYQIGTVYEIKKKIGNPAINIPFNYVGTSFTRDGSQTRNITQEDRERILKLNIQNRINYDPEYFEEEEFDEEYKSSQRYIENRTINVELINNYIEIMKSKRRSNENVLNILDSIQNEARKLDNFDLINKEEATSVFNSFITFSTQFFLDYDDKVVIIILNMLKNFAKNENCNFINTIVRNLYDTLVELYLKGNRYSSLVHILNYCGYFSDLYGIIINAIKEKDIELLKSVKNFKLEDYTKIDNIWEKIRELLELKEEMDQSVHIDKVIIGLIDNIIKILEKVV